MRFDRVEVQVRQGDEGHPKEVHIPVLSVPAKSNFKSGTYTVVIGSDDPGGGVITGDDPGVITGDEPK